MKHQVSASVIRLSQAETLKGIHAIKEFFQKELSDILRLQAVPAPMIVEPGSGLQDDLNGVEEPVKFSPKDFPGEEIQVVQSLAKWKRRGLRDFKVPEGEGIVADMRALRPDEVVGPLHSIFVDQWDWEKHIREEDRSVGYLKRTVREIFKAMKRAEAMVAEMYPQIQPILPDQIEFIHSEELASWYPELSPKEREAKAAKEFGAIFVIGIGGPLGSGPEHDGRAPDYDDWSTISEEGRAGLNGDIIVWHPGLEIPFELSSMGIRVDGEALIRQLEIRGATYRMAYPFHQDVLHRRVPFSIGGGIGQSRLCMFLLRKRHIGEVQSSLWPDSVRSGCADEGIELL